MKVLKFGGSSIASAERIEKVIEIVRNATKEDKDIVVVLSALGGATDMLLKIATLAAQGDKVYRELLKELEARHIEAVEILIPASERSDVLINVKMALKDLADILQGIFLVWETSPRTLDFVMSFGESLSTYLVSQALRVRGIENAFLDARDVVRTDEAFGGARVNDEETNKLIREFHRKNPGLVLMTGFLAGTDKGETTTLGRGGSDYTASIAGAALNASEIQIWTDVDGMMTADPRKVGKAFSIESVTYEEAMELSHFGAKVIHPPTMQPALEKKIPIQIKNTFRPEAAGTLISSVKGEYPFAVTGVTSIPEIALLRVQGSGMVGVPGVSMRLFGALARNEISVILITQASSEHTICFAVKPEDSTRAKYAVDEEFALELQAGILDDLVIEDKLSIISAVGENMRLRTGVAARMFHSLGKNGINISAIAQGSSERNISVVVSSSDEKKALNALHDELFLSQAKSLNLFIVGTGLIGGTLLAQIEQHRESLLEEHALDIRVIGVANSRNMLLEESGLALDSCQELLESSEQVGGVEPFIEIMKSINLPSSVFVDCTASESVVELYQDVLQANIPVVTPNKKAQSANQETYSALKEVSMRRGVEFLFETSVGAGLPVISTLGDLLKSGDKIHRIEAVLSGTLSYIFNTFGPPHTFSGVVSEARERGFTEPDPRDDLCGLDVARKILILAREAGYSLELGDVEVENLVPEKARKAESVDEFLSLLEKSDDEFENRRKSAEDKGAKLCYIASLEEGKAEVSLQEVGSDHPFFGLSGSDNIVSFTTSRYTDRPLVVKGPGAGAEVTAAGIFADIIRVAR